MLKTFLWKIIPPRDLHSAHMCTHDNCANQCKLVSEYILDLFNETCYSGQVHSAPFLWSGQLSSLWLHRSLALGHLGVSGGPMKSFTGLLGHLYISGGLSKVSGGPMTSF